MTYEVIIVQTVEDSRRAELYGLYDFRAANAHECENCSMIIGPTPEEFLPCVIVADLDNEEAWTICTDCAMATIAPGFWRQHRARLEEGEE